MYIYPLQNGKRSGKNQWVEAGFLAKVQARGRFKNWREDDGSEPEPLKYNLPEYKAITEKEIEKMLDYYQVKYASKACKTSKYNLLQQTLINLK